MTVVEMVFRTMSCGETRTHYKKLKDMGIKNYNSIFREVEDE